MKSRWCKTCKYYTCYLWVNECESVQLDSCLLHVQEDKSNCKYYEGEEEA